MLCFIILSTLSLITIRWQNFIINLSFIWTKSGNHSKLCKVCSNSRTLSSLIIFPFKHTNRRWISCCQIMCRVTCIWLILHCIYCIYFFHARLANSHATASIHTCVPLFHTIYIYILFVQFQNTIPTYTSYYYKVHL